MRAVRYHAKRGNPNFSFQFGDEMSINPQNIEIIFRFGFSRNAELRRIWREILLFLSSVSPSRSEFEKSRNENFLTDLNKPNLETFPTELQKKIPPGVGAPERDRVLINFAESNQYPHFTILFVWWKEVFLWLKRRNAQG